MLFVAAMALVIAGWKMTGELAGLGIMVVGVFLLLWCWRSTMSYIEINNCEE